MKIITLLFTIFFLSAMPVQPAYSQKSEVKPAFKIVGDNSITIQNGSGSKMSVEYDTASVDHLYLSEFRKNGIIMTKTRLLFNGGKFNLNNLAEYSNKGGIDD